MPSKVKYFYYQLISVFVYFSFFVEKLHCKKFIIFCLNRILIVKACLPYLELL